ncbi:MAG: hypothetical protein WD768_17720 [Phycisphaeraceae bacterium]
MERTNRLLDCYLPPGEGFVLESLVATTYQVDFEFVEEDLLAVAFGVRSPVSRHWAFRSELERKLQKAEVTVMYDLGGCGKRARLSPRIDAIPIVSRKLHSKISLLMWVRESGAEKDKTERRMRLIVGSANLTRQGFRHNYECVASVDFGGRNTSPRLLLTVAIGLVKQIAAETNVTQLARQLAAFTKQTALLPVGATEAEDPVALVAASDVVQIVRDSWTAISAKAPETVTVVSPFWPEGSSAAEALAGLFRQLGPPKNMELVCRGERSADGKEWLPVFDSALAIEIKKRLGTGLCLRAALPGSALQDSSPPAVDIGDETEEEAFKNSLGSGSNVSSDIQRALHAKMILLDGTEGSVIYTGSSNCTRRGLSLGGPSNFEAGFVYRLSPSQRKRLTGLLEFAGPAIEVHANSAPATVHPTDEDESVVPIFLAEVIATGTIVTVRFRDVVPSDLVLLMPIPAKSEDAGFWLLYQPDAQRQGQPETITTDLISCDRCDDTLRRLPTESASQQAQPNVFIEARWHGHSANYPVRFDDKTQLPLILMGRKPTEGELIEYFLFGKEPDEWDDGGGSSGDGSPGPKPDAPIDTRRILAYFIRRFVQAIPGIEAEIHRACYSFSSLDAVLRGPTSPLELAERAFASLTRPPSNYEPLKTPTAVGFQFPEILAALTRCQAAAVDSELHECFTPVITRCRELLDTLASRYEELQTEGFCLYRARILGDAN